jgi:ribosomal protein S18 acetylase RimI-like enzyme
VAQPLDHPVRASLLGAHQHFALHSGQALRYEPDVSVFAAVLDHEDGAGFADLSALVEPEDTVAVVGDPVGETPGFSILFRGVGYQMIGQAVEGRKDASVVSLLASHVDQMLDLVARTEPGPFVHRTHEMGQYFGFFQDDQLIAMAGQRMNPGVGHELSAVCTDPDFMRQGLAERLIRHLVALDHQAGLVPFLHVAQSNVGAQKLYERLGFTFRREIVFTRLERLQDR